MSDLLPSSVYRAHTFTNGVVGKAVKGVMCTYQYSGGVSLVSYYFYFNKKWNEDN